MKKFAYEARDSSTGKIVKASVQAENEYSAAKLLADQGFIPLDIKAQNEDDGIIGRFMGRIGTKDRVVFSRQLATLIGAGLPLSQSLRTVIEQTENKRLKDVIQDVLTAIEGGRPLAESFGKHPEVFDKVFLSLISAGEASGTLDDALRRIAAQQEKDAATMSKIRGAMTYPVIVMVVIFGVMAFMLFTVVPQVQTLYEDLGQKLPLLTAVMVWLADFAIRFWWLIIILAGVGIYFLMQ
jgi:type IV pilus assembly protein PilC